ncbi:MAG: flavin reductase [Bacillota bacterium]
MSAKRWRCTVCNYIHVGEEPPGKCPVCGVGPEFFELLGEAVEAEGDTEKEKQRALQEILFKIQYGLYVVTSGNNGKYNGQVCNTVFQVTGSPLVVAVGINKQNLTHEFIGGSNSFTVCVLGQDCQEIVKRFGYQSGRNTDKFSGLDYDLSPIGNPILKDCIAYFDCQVLREKCVDLGTHTLFIGQVQSGQINDDNEEPITYAGYRKARNK